MYIYSGVYYTSYAAATKILNIFSTAVLLPLENREIGSQIIRASHTHTHIFNQNWAACCAITTLCLTSASGELAISTHHPGRFDQSRTLSLSPRTANRAQTLTWIQTVHTVRVGFVGQARVPSLTSGGRVAVTPNNRFSKPAPKNKLSREPRRQLPHG